MLRDMSLSFVKSVVGNQAYRRLINIHLTQMYSDCVNSARTAKDRNFTTTNPLANTALSKSERAYYLSKWKSRICLSCDVTIFCIALAIPAITINLCLVYIETTVCLITNHCFNEWKAHISKHLYRNLDNLFIRNKNRLRAQKFV